MILHEAIGEIKKKEEDCKKIIMQYNYFLDNLL